MWGYTENADFFIKNNKSKMIKRSETKENVSDLFIILIESILLRIGKCFLNKNLDLMREIWYNKYATQLNNWANYKRSVLLWKKHILFLAFSCGLSKLCRSNWSYVFFGALTLVGALFIFKYELGDGDSDSYNW